MEPLAAALGISVSELMACSKEPNSTADSPVRTILDVAEASRRKQRRNTCISTICLILLVALLIGAICLIFDRESNYLYFVHKQFEDGNYYVYAENKSHLLRLRCEDQQMYNYIEADGDTVYYMEYTINHLTQHGNLKVCEYTENFFLQPGLQQGSIGYDSLLGIDYTWQECNFQYPDPNPEMSRGYLFTYTFYYLGDGKESYLDKYDEMPRTDMFRVDSCRAVAPYDYDNDGIVELFVWTRFKEEPYMLYELVDGNIESLFIDVKEVPDQVYDWLHSA